MSGVPVMKTKKTARRIDEEQSGVHRDVQLWIVLESGRPQAADAALRVAARSIP